jgi:choice-of-anchor C domain-containing protein
LLRQAEKTKDDSAARFVLLREAANVAARAGDFDAACRALEVLEKEFAVDGVSLRVTALGAAALEAKTTLAQKAVVEAGLDLLNEAVAAESFEAGRDALKLAQAAAGEAKSLALTGRVKSRREEFDEIVKEYEAVKAARAKLKDNPDDATANSVAGKFLCVRQGRWDRGLPLLARGAGTMLKALAAADLAKPDQAGKQVEVGDGWWSMAESQSGTAKGALQDRACHWYAQALPHLTGITKTRVEKRLQSAEGRRPQGKNLLVNGSFEEGPESTADGYRTLQKGSTAIKGWQVTQGDIDHIGPFWQAADGQRSLDLNGLTRGGIAQTFKTIKGRRYRVTFSLAGNPIEGGGERKLLVSAAGKSAEFVFDSRNKAVHDMGWVSKTWEFIAVADQTTLEFASLTEGASGPALDNVSVVALRR